MARTASGNTLNIADLQRILGERTKQLGKLGKKRAKLVAQIDDLDAEIHKLSGGEGGRMKSVGSAGAGSTGGGTRAKNDKPLPDFMEEVLAKNGKPMRVGEIVDGVQALGYRSNSKAFKNIVNQMLIKERKRFQQVDRGIYGLAGKK